MHFAPKLHCNAFVFAQICNISDTTFAIFLQHQEQCMLGASRWAPPFCYTESRTALGGRGGGRFYLPLLSTALYCSPNWSWHQTQSFDLMLSHRANIELTSQRAGLPWGKGAEDGFTIHSPCFSPNWSWHQTQSFDLMLSKQEHIELR